MCLVNCVQYIHNWDWEDKPDASSHTEQEESNAALQLQEITLLLMTQVSRESSAEFNRSEAYCTLYTCMSGRAVQRVAELTHTHSYICFLCCFLPHNKNVFSKSSNTITVSPCFSLPQHQLTNIGADKMKRRKSVKLPLDDKSLQRDFPQQHVQWSA